MNGLIESADAFELLHTDEFAKRLKVGRTTIFKWKKEGTLIPGRHYIKNGKIVRYIWALDLIMEIQEITTQEPKFIKQEPTCSKTQRPRPKKNSVINLEY